MIFVSLVFHACLCDCHVARLSPSLPIFMISFTCSIRRDRHFSAYQQAKTFFRFHHGESAYQRKAFFGRRGRFDPNRRYQEGAKIAISDKETGSPVWTLEMVSTFR